MGGKCHLIVFNSLKPPSIKFRTLYFDGALYGSWLAHKPLINCSQTAHKLPAIDWEACAYLVGIWPWSNWSKPGSIVMLRLFMTLHSHAAHTLFMRCSYSLPNGLGAALVWFFQSSMESCSLIARSAICGLLINCSWTAHKLLIKRLCAEDWLAYGRDLVAAIHIDCISVCIRSWFSIYKLFISCFYTFHILLQAGGSCCLMCNGLNFP